MASGLDLARTVPAQQQGGGGGAAAAATAVPTMRPFIIGRALSFDNVRAATSVQQQQPAVAGGSGAHAWDGMPLAASSPAAALPSGSCVTPVPDAWHGTASAPLFTAGLDVASALAAAQSMMQMLSPPQ
jgi:hypothetical protein